MRRSEVIQAYRLAAGLVERTRGSTRETALEICELLAPPPGLAEIMLKIPARTHLERARAIGISRQAYYNLMYGHARPNRLTAKRLAALTGVDEGVIRER